MPKIFCGRVDCKYNNDKNVCKADKIKLIYRNMYDVYNGRTEMLVCNKYEISEEAKMIRDAFVDWLSKGGD